MPTEVWLAITSSLLTAVGAMFTWGYRDISRRLTQLEHQDTKLNAAILTLLVAKSDDSTAIANALHGLLANGVKTT